AVRCRSGVHALAVWWVPALRSSVKNAAPRPGHEVSRHSPGCLLTLSEIVIKYNYSAQEAITPMGNAAPAATAGHSELLKIEQAGPVLTVGLNRPAKRNALNDGIMLAIQHCFSNLPEGVGAVVIHGVGDHFSSGLDLSELTEHDATEGLRHSQMWHRVFDRIQYSRVPVIAA